MLLKESFLGLNANPVVMEIVQLCIRNTRETLEGLTTWIVHIKGPIFANVPLTALARRVCLINYTSSAFSFD